MWYLSFSDLFCVALHALAPSTSLQTLGIILDHRSPWVSAERLNVSSYVKASMNNPSINHPTNRAGDPDNRLHIGTLLDKEMLGSYQNRDPVKELTLEVEENKLVTITV